MEMQDLIDDLQASLSQMNKSLSDIAAQNEAQTKLLEKIAESLDKS